MALVTTEMTASAFPTNGTRFRLLILWMTGFVAIAVIGSLLTLDLSGSSAADRFVIGHWGFRGLRFYLWFEAGVLVAIVAAVGWSALNAGLAFVRGGAAALYGADVTMRVRIPNQLGYLLVLLGAALIAMSVTTLVLFNSCRYMRIV